MHLSPDGLIRVSLDELLSIPIVHLMSGVDEDTRGGAVCGTPTTISGYTEWVSKVEPTISIGWDWTLGPQGHDGRYQRVGLPRANVMLVDAQGADRPWHENLEHLGTVVDVLPWAELLPQHLSN